jgi:hypothetical protein
MSDGVPADVPLDGQDEGPEPAPTGRRESFDEIGEGLDKRGLGSETTPANPLSPDAGLSSTQAADELAEPPSG